jgi:CheY-like chemotaxis protein
MLGITTMKLFQQWMRTSSEDATVQSLQRGNADLLIVGMSATALESEQEEAFSYGMHFFCPKPVSLDLLGIILEAKRDCANNDAAVDQICEVTGTNMMEKEEEDRRHAVEQQLQASVATNMNGSSTSNINNEFSTQSSEDHNPNSTSTKHNNTDNSGSSNSSNNNNKTKWNIFRSHKQMTKVSPENIER